ncbi:MAG: hypothetical protein ACREOH_14870 [Candidatus Entotheonellia bacterium]
MRSSAAAQMMRGSTILGLTSLVEGLTVGALQHGPSVLYTPMFSVTCCGLEGTPGGQSAMLCGSLTAIFIRDTALADAAQLRAALRLGMSYVFHRDVYRAIVGLNHAIPRSAE